MCETCKPPVASLRARNRHRSFHFQSQRAPRDDAKLAVRRIRQNSTECNRTRQNATKTRARTRARQRRSVSIPRGAGRNVRDMQTAGRVAPRPEPSPLIPLPIAARPKRRCQTCRQEDPTECDRIRQNATKTRARTRARQRRSVFHFLATGCDLGAADSTYRIARSWPPPSRHANRPNRPNGTPSSQLVACNSHVCYYFPSIGERRQT